MATTVAKETSGRVFDCAIGSGEITAAIIAAGGFNGATLLDLSPKMLEIASGTIERKIAETSTAKIELICDDVFHFARENSHRKYDLVLCLGLIAHTGRLQELMQLLGGMLEKDGVILLQTTLLDHFGTRIERFFSEDRYFKKHGYRISYFRHQDVEAVCSAAGLRIAGRKRYALGLPFGDRLWAWGNYQLERIFQGWAAAHGSEAIYLLKLDAAS